MHTKIPRHRNTFNFKSKGVAFSTSLSYNQLTIIFQIYFSDSFQSTFHTFQSNTLPKKGVPMNYFEFVEDVCEQCNFLLKSNVKASIHQTLKNNSTDRIGIMLTDASTNIHPTIYLEEFYQQYLDGRDTFDIATNITHLYSEIRFEECWNTNQILDFEIAKSRIAFKLIHFDKNQRLLKDIPHLKFLDLAIVFYILLDQTEKGTASVLITHDMLKHWQQSLMKIYCYAATNTPALLTAELMPMNDVIVELLGVTSDAYVPEDENHMYILSNELRHFGAACILYDPVLEDISKVLEDDFYVLPSSIHEVIILSAKHAPSQTDLDEMIAEINNTQVADEEILSDHAYYYSRKQKRLLLCSHSHK